MTVVTRFAPSPTGHLHLGHAFSALKAHDLAREASGRFLLRIEDIDPGRTREAFVASIVDDLHWLGLTWDEPIIRQSTRLVVYEDALTRLRASDLIYPCFCTRAEIAASTIAPHGDEGPIYPGTCRSLPVSEARLSEDQHCWRLDMAKALARVGTTPLRWHDAATGWIDADPAGHGDVVLARKDAPASYHLAVVIDDAAQGITDIVRGTDLFAATHVHRLLQALLDLPTPLYHHHPLLTDASGRRLAKRHNSPSLADLRRAGADPIKVTADLRADRLPIGFASAEA